MPVIIVFTENIFLVYEYVTKIDIKNFYTIFIFEYKFLCGIFTQDNIEV